jgi:large subunit ribosomal protein L5
VTRLEQYYRETVARDLQAQFGYSSAMEIPRVTKITVNMGIGEASQDKKIIDHATSDMSLITGQKPIVTLAKKAIAGFKLREDMPIGCKVTLRRDKMYEFMDRLINFAIPRIRDFRGLSAKAFDGQGNYNMGISEQIAFPEIDYDKIDKLRGMNICFTTTARNAEEGRALLSAFQFPFKN